MGTTASSQHLIRGVAYDHIPQTVGNTPMVKLNRVAPDDANVYVKCEFFNPLASVKDRIGLAMIDAARQSGQINDQTHIIEPTSGNTGIALAFVCAARGYQLTLTMPESMSLERRAILRALGAQLVLTPAEGGMKTAIEKAAEMVNNQDNAWMPQQFENSANPEIHHKTTGPEIWNDLDSKVDMLVAGVGTGGTITGAGRYLKEHNAKVKCIAVEPTGSAVISGGKPGPHKIQGLGAGFIPENLDTNLLDGTEQVTDEEAFDWARRVAAEEGILGGISTGANVCAAVRLAAKPEHKGKTIVTIAPSFGERYLSTPLFEGLMD